MSYANNVSRANFDEFNVTDFPSDFVNETVSDMTLTDIFTEELAYVLNIYFTPALIIMGTVGNFLSILVFFKSKLRKQSTSEYLTALALSDNIFLLQLIPPWLKAVSVSRLFVRDGFCQFFVYLTYVSSSCSAWLVVSFTIERFVAVIYPLRRTRVCTVRRARLLILAITLSCLAINTPVLKFAVPKGNDCNIDFDLMEHAARFNVVDTIFSFTLPLTIITVLNVWITIGVCKLGQARGHLINEMERQPRRLDCSRRSQQRITKMLLTVSSVFVLLNLPAYSMRIAAYANNMSSYEYYGKWAALQQICLLFFNINFGINFFLYCMTGQNFRRALCQMVPCSCTSVQLCCAPPSHDLRPRPRPSGTNSLSINTDASMNAATPRVNYHQNNEEEALANVRREQPQEDIQFELHEYPVQDFGLPMRPQPRWPDNSSASSSPRPASNPALSSVITSQIFQPIPYILAPGQIAPLENICPSPSSADSESSQLVSPLLIVDTPPRASTNSLAPSSPSEHAISLLTRQQLANLSAESESLPSATASPPDSPISRDLMLSYMWSSNRYYLSTPVREQPPRRFSLPARQWYGLERKDTPPGWPAMPPAPPPPQAWELARAVPSRLVRAPARACS